MAYISQDTKKQIQELIKPILKKYGIKATLSIKHYSTLELNIHAGKLDFLGDAEKTLKYDISGGYISPHRCRYTEWFKDRTILAFFDEVVPLLYTPGWRNNSDPMTDYFDITYYIDINIGRWNKPYKLETK